MMGALTEGVRQGLTELERIEVGKLVAGFMDAYNAEGETPQVEDFVAEGSSPEVRKGVRLNIQTALALFDLGRTLSRLTG